MMIIHIYVLKYITINVYIIDVIRLFVRKVSHNSSANGHHSVAVNINDTYISSWICLQSQPSGRMEL